MKLEKSKRAEMLNKLEAVNGATIRQISRITGISKGIVERA
jgi:hypothetical protein